MAGVKRRVYEAAKDMGMSSEALVSVLKTMSVEVKQRQSFKVKPFVATTSSSWSTYK